MKDAAPSRKALIVEDDKEIASIVSLNIKDLDLETEIAANGKTGLQMALRGGYSVIILDIMLPGLDGISVCRKIRENDPYTPIMMLTAKTDEIDRVLGLEFGADDYMTKPFSVRELIARVKALLRRAGTPPAPSPDTASGVSGSAVIRIGDLIVDFTKRNVIIADRSVALTVKEFDLLALFVRNPGRAYSRADLLTLVWGYNFEGYEHTVNTHIGRLRNKIEKDPSNPEYLKTVWGVGYRLTEDRELRE